MSISERTAFDDWLADMVREHGQFTVLVILTAMGEGNVTPLCSTYMHVTGDAVDWEEIKIMFAGSGHSWDGAVFFPTKAANGGPIDNPTARLRLAELEAKVGQNRMILNDGHFFDTEGRRIRVDPVTDG
ncbi:MAG: hypothetical protein J2P50_07680 [Hyphomicrobiaceae bacterium]|nr:hypothetical protein [Hyphomicrobiaceae bacterium]